MVKEKILIINKLGLHARAAMKLVNTASRFGSETIIHHLGNEVNAKSIMNVLVLGAHQGTELEFVITGEDEQAALSAIKKLINDRFDEDE